MLAKKCGKTSRILSGFHASTPTASNLPWLPVFALQTFNLALFSLMSRKDGVWLPSENGNHTTEVSLSQKRNNQYALLYVDMLSNAANNTLFVTGYDKSPMKVSNGLSRNLKKGAVNDKTLPLQPEVLVALRWHLSLASSCLQWWRVWSQVQLSPG